MFFLRDWWEKEKISIVKIFLSSKKTTKKLKSFITKMNAISDSVREALL